MPVKVSVIVPARQSASDLQVTLASLRAQTLPAEELEILLVGPDQPVSAPLDQAWDAGVATATGEYVLLVEPGATLPREALAKLYELGHRNLADIVIGKQSSPEPVEGASLVHGVRDKVTIHDFPLYEIVSSGQLFRKAFLDEQRLLYGSAARPLAHQIFLLRSYFAAQIVSILGDFACYQAPSRPVVPAADALEYTAGLRELVEVVESRTPPHDLRIAALRRIYRAELLARIPAIQEGNDALLAELQRAATELFPGELTGALPAISRMRSDLLRATRLDALIELGRRADSVDAHATLSDLEWVDGKLELTLSAVLTQGTDAVPLGLLRRGGQYFVDPEFSAGLLDWEDGEVTKELSGFRVDITLRNAETGADWWVPAKLELHVDEGESAGDGTRCAVTFRGKATLDPERVAGKRVLPPGSWDLWVQVRMLGLDRRVRLGASSSDALAAKLLPAALGRPAQVVIPFFTGGGGLSIDVGRHALGLAQALSHAHAIPGPGNGRRLELGLPVVSRRGSGSLPAQVVIRDDGSRATSVMLPARLESAGPRARLIADLGADSPGPLLRLRPGKWQVIGLLDGELGPEVPLGKLEVDQRSRAYLVGGDRIGLVTDLSRRAARAAIARPGLKRLGVRVVDRLPTNWRHRIRAAVQRARAAV